MKNRQEKKGTGKSALEKWSDLLSSVSQLVIVLAVVVVLVMFGRWLLFRGSGAAKAPKIQNKPVAPQVDWSMVDREVAGVMKNARSKARSLADKELNQWTEQCMERVDRDFLDWYFSYWTQQELGLKTLLYQVVHWVNSDTPTPAERITRQVQEEFAARVVRPQIAQMEMERMVKETVDLYVRELSAGLKPIPARYSIRPAEWNRYTGDVAVIAGGTDAGRRVSLSLKVLAGVSAGGALLLFRFVRPLLARAGSRISARLAGKTAATMATKTGTGVVARMGGKLGGAIIAVGIIIWDVWDHFDTVRKARPLLRQNIADYFRELKKAVLDDPEFGIMTVIRALEEKVATRQARNQKSSGGNLNNKP